jgi:hypothetical protein
LGCQAYSREGSKYSVGKTDIKFGSYRLPGQRGPRPTPFLYLADCEDPRAALEACVGELAHYDGPEPPPKPEPKVTTVRRELTFAELENSPLFDVVVDPRVRADPALEAVLNLLRRESPHPLPPS